MQLVLFLIRIHRDNFFLSVSLETDEIPEELKECVTVSL